MLFAHDTREALNAAADLVNTMPGRSFDAADLLQNADDLARYLAVHPSSGVVHSSDDEVAGLRAIRPRLRALWGLDREHAVPAVNAMLRDGNALPRLVIHDEYDWHIHAVSDDEPLPDRVLVETAMAFVDVIRADEYARIRVCEADDCDGVYVDYSRNRSKRYCDAGNCGNRMNVNAYRRRMAERESR